MNALLIIRSQVLPRKALPATEWGMGVVLMAMGVMAAIAIPIFISVIVLAKVAGVRVLGDYTVIALAFIQHAAIIVAIWLVVVRPSKTSWGSLGFWRRPNKTDAKMGSVGLGVLVVISLAYMVLLWSLDVAQPNPDLFYDTPTPAFALLAVLAVFMAPVSEELAFRALLFGGLCTRLKPVSAAIVSSLVFMAVHGNPIGFPIYFAFGLILCWVYYKTRALYATMALHFLINAVAMTQMSIMRATEA